MKATRIVLALSLLALTRCSHLNAHDTSGVVNDAAQVIRPGETRMLEVIAPENSALYCKNIRLKSARNKNRLIAFIAEPYESDFQPFDCQVRVGEDVLRHVPFTIEKREYPSEKINVAKGHVDVSAKDQARSDADDVLLRKALASSSDTPLFEKPFHLPLTSKHTSEYGTQRVFNDKMKTEHLGIDYRAGEGKRIPVSNAGKVVFTGNLFKSGNCVIVDHGLDVFTQYNHLSKIFVKEGDLLKPRQAVGLAGHTGRVSGPHLHWTVIVQGQRIDGETLVRETATFSMPLEH